MKKLLTLLFSMLISINSYSEVELDTLSKKFCDHSSQVQLRGNLFYLPNQEKPYSGENLCIYLVNGQYYNQGEIEEGLRQGTWFYWHENGQKDKILWFQFGNLISETKFLYYGSDLIQSVETYKNGKLDGERTWWYENGQMKSEVKWKNGIKNGKFTSWHENGQIKNESNFKDGECISGDCPN